MPSRDSGAQLSCTQPPLLPILSLPLGLGSPSLRLPSGVWLRRSIRNSSFSPAPFGLLMGTAQALEARGLGPGFWFQHVLCDPGKARAFWPVCKKAGSYSLCLLVEEGSACLCLGLWRVPFLSSLDVVGGYSIHPGGGVIDEETTGNMATLSGYRLGGGCHSHPPPTQPALSGCVSHPFPSSLSWPCCLALWVIN